MDAPAAAPSAAAADEEEEFKPTLWTVSTGGGAKNDVDDDDADGNAGVKGKSAGDGGGAGKGGGGGGGAAAADDAAAVSLSKNAQKRAAKFELWEKRKAAKKAQEKQEKEQRGEEVRLAHKQKMEAMSEEERAAYEEERSAARANRKKDAEEAKEKKKAALTAPNAVILDLEFGHLMEDKEMRSMAKQLTFCYSANTKAQVPVRLYLTGFEGRMGEIARKACSGFENWAVVSSEESYLDAPALVEQRKDLVYLTADSEHELEDFKEDDIYIIGGIVDRNRYKNLTLDKANEQGIRHARLPIQNHLKMTGTHVSTTSLLSFPTFLPGLVWFRFGRACARRACARVPETTEYFHRCVGEKENSLDADPDADAFPHQPLTNQLFVPPSEKTNRF